MGHVSEEKGKDDSRDGICQSSNGSKFQTGKKRKSVHHGFRRDSMVIRHPAFLRCPAGKVNATLIDYIFIAAPVARPGKGRKPIRGLARQACPCDQRATNPAHGRECKTSNPSKSYPAMMTPV
ncbi:hypothetical protein [Rhizobium sp. YJ-22]|uniref:hypothetical protein n=1 Tax=Rhizobium sp. YJ-22 TaxID=3037556 RepID=UPI002412358F|nr:hypothetical protein [Rhizobium sp. YJ-22]